MLALFDSLLISFPRGPILTHGRFENFGAPKLRRKLEVRQVCVTDIAFVFMHNR